MCSSTKDACKSNACCSLLLNLYCQVWQLLIYCPANSELEIDVGMGYLTLSWLTPTLQALYPMTKCGKINCCDGVAESILCAFQVVLGALTTADNDSESVILNSFAATLIGILIQAGVTLLPTYPEY